MPRADKARLNLNVWICGVCVFLCVCVLVQSLLSGTKHTHLSRQTSDMWGKVDEVANLQLQPKEEEEEKHSTVYFITWKWKNEFCQHMAHLFPLTSMDSWHLIYLLCIGSNGVKKGRDKREREDSCCPYVFPSQPLKRPVHLTEHASLKGHPSNRCV